MGGRPAGQEEAEEERTEENPLLSEEIKGGESMSESCKLCGEPLPLKALHFSNELAIEHGYCSWMCMISDLGEKKTMAILQKDSGKPMP